MARVLLATQKVAQIESYARLKGSKVGRTDISRYVMAVQGEYGIEYHSANGACHSFLQRYKKLVALSTSPSVKVWRDRSKAGYDARGSKYSGSLTGFYDKAVAYWEYLVRESPLESIFLTKGIKEAEEGGVFININTPANLAMLAIVGTREPHEFPNRVEIWYSLVQAGADPWISLLLMEHLAVDVREGGRLLYRTTCGDIHDMFCSDEFDSEGMRNFVNSKYPGAKQPLSTSGDYRGIHSLWGKQPRTRRVTVLDSYFKCMPEDATRMKTVYHRGEYTSRPAPATSYEAGIAYMADVSHALRGDYHEAA